jgi:hypothetical protein
MEILEPHRYEVTRMKRCVDELHNLYNSLNRLLSEQLNREG